MGDLEYMEQLLKIYCREACGIELFASSANKAKIKRLGIELRQAMIEFERKNSI
ncbi:TPA: hypothetical protein U1X88_000686 [Streptococcus suis]|nr:hypothetical protein [Streptococcus suis]